MSILVQQCHFTDLRCETLSRRGRISSIAPGGTEVHSILSLTLARLCWRVKHRAAQSTVFSFLVFKLITWFTEHNKLDTRSLARLAYISLMVDNIKLVLGLGTEKAGVMYTYYTSKSITILMLI